MTQETAGRAGSLVSGAALALGMSALAARPVWALPLAPGVAPRAPAEVPSKVATELLVLDPRVAGHQAFLRAVRPRVATLVLDPQCDGLAQIAEALAAYPSVDVVHLVAHGQPGLLQLGATALTPESASAHGDPLRRWFRPRAPFERRPEVLLYGCSAAAGPRGQALVRTLASLTGADVAGSLDATGGAAAGANWVLEAATGAINASLPFRPDLAQAYPGTLDIFQVSNTNSSGPGSLAQAISDANSNDNGSPGDTIVFTRSGCTDAAAGVCDGDAGALLTDGTVTGTITVGSTLSVTEPLTIEGPGADLLAIDGGGTLTIFHTTNTDMTVRDLTIQNGTHGIYVKGGSLDIEACDIYGNSAIGDYGGAILGVSANITIANSVLRGNSADFGGAISTKRGAIDIEACVISGNHAIGNDGNDGGAIRGWDADITIIDSVLSGNSANEGGAISVWRGFNLYLMRSTIAGNTAFFDGGGISAYGYSADVTVKNSTISGNHAEKGAGAGVFIGNNVDASFDHVTITNNVDDSTDDCSAAGIDACDLYSGHKVELLNTIVAGNLLEKEGGNLVLAVDVAGKSNDSFVEVHTSLIGKVRDTSTIHSSNDVLLVPDFVLGPLAENGGLTPTHELLLKGSQAAIDSAGDSDLAFDQRGFPRVGDAADIGAFEWDLTSIVDAWPGELDASTGGGSDGGIGGGAGGSGGETDGGGGTDGGSGGGTGSSGVGTDGGVDGGSCSSGDGCGCSVPGGGNTPASAGGLFTALMGLLGWRSRRWRR